MHQIGNHLSYTPYYAACPKRRVTVVVEKTKRTAVTLDIVVDESRNKMADGVTRSPARLCSRDGKICYYGRLEYDFSAFVPCFPLVLFSPAFSWFIYLLRVCSSVQQPSATLSKYVFCSTCSFFFASFVSCLLSKFLCFSSFRIFL